MGWIPAAVDCRELLPSRIFSRAYLSNLIIFFQSSANQCLTGPVSAKPAFAKNSTHKLPRHGLGV
jgi:hypothetical protein